MQLDYRSLGLKVGIEVHQELDTSHKLFCHCPPRLFQKEAEFTLGDASGQLRVSWARSILQLCLSLNKESL